MFKNAIKKVKQNEYDIKDEPGFAVIERHNRGFPQSCPTGIFPDK